MRRDVQPSTSVAVALPFFRLALLLTGVFFLSVMSSIGIVLIAVALLSSAASVVVGAAVWRSSS